LNEIISGFPDYLTGADIGSVTNQSFKIAFQRKLSELTKDFLEREKVQNPMPAPSDQELSLGSNNDHLLSLFQNPSYANRCQQYMNHLTKSQLVLEITQADLFQACQSLKPTMINLSHYEALQKKFENI
jgi:EAL domain-containing protein (putative c-di-GMP-specific phosphodiesterase class I)